MIPPPPTFPDLASSGIRVTSLGSEGPGKMATHWIILVQRGTEADRLLEQYMSDRISGIKVQPPKPPDLPPAVLRGLPTAGIMALNTHGAAWLILVGSNTPESEAIKDFMLRHSQQRPRPQA